MKVALSLILLLLSFNVATEAQSIKKLTEPDKSPGSKYLTEDTVSFDPSIKKGKLANGFTYFIGNRESDKIYLRLIVKAGYYREKKNQIAFAHLLEHAAFRGTKTFPGDSLDRYLASYGVKKGEDYTASTGYFSTDYRFGLPAGKPDLLINALRAMRDWAQSGMLLTDAGIDLERKVVMEEYRTRSSPKLETTRNAIAKTLTKTDLSVRFNTSSADEKEVVLTADPDSLRNFYREWYRPDLQGLIVMGPVDQHETEKLIGELFSDLVIPKYKSNLSYKVPVMKTGQFIVATHGDNNAFPYAEIKLYIQSPSANKSTDVSDYKQSLIGELYTSMMTERFKRINLERPQRPFANMWSYHTNDLVNGSGFRNRGIQSIVSFAPVNIDKMEAGLKALVVEMERVTRHGFIESEFKQSRESLLSAYRSMNMESPSHQIKDIVNNFLFDDPVPSPTLKKKMFLTLLNGITLQEMNDVATRWLTSDHINVVLIAPEEIGKHLPDGATIKRWVDESKKINLQPYTDKKETQVDFHKSFELNKIIIIAVETNENTGVVKVSLPNNARLVIIPSSSPKLSFHGFSPGGYNNYNGPERLAAREAAKAIRLMGIAEFDPSQLANYLETHDLTISPYINGTTEGVKGTCKENDVELLMQLAYRYFTAPRKMKERFDAYVDNQRSYSEKYNTKRSDLTTEILNFGVNDFQMISPGEWDNVTLDRCYEIYKERFSNAGDFTFIISGVKNVDEVISRASQYLGALPDNKIREVNQPWRLPDFKSYAEEVANKSLLDEANVNLVYAGTYHYDVENNIKLDILINILDVILSRKIIEDEGGAYTLSADTYYLKYLGDSSQGAYKQTVSFKCMPQRRKNLIAIARKVIELLKEKGPPEEVFTNVVKDYRDDQVQGPTDEAFRVNYLVGKYLRAEDPGHIPEIEEEHRRAKDVINSLTREDIRKAAVEFLKDDRSITYVEVSEAGF